MTRPVRMTLIGLALIAAGGLAVAYLAAGDLRSVLTGRKPLAILPGSDAETVDVVDRKPPPEVAVPVLADDRIEDKQPAFDPDAVDRRPWGDWSVNASAAVIRLDVPMVLPDVQPELVRLHPSYAAALRAHGWRTVLPSINLVDGKAKQVDDGLVAALDQAYFLGRGEALPSLLALVRRLQARVAPASPAADYLTAALHLGGDPVALTDRARASVQAFEARPVLSQPVGFYRWTEPLTRAFRMLRYLSQPIADRSVATAIARVLRDDPGLRADYARATGFYAQLTNPAAGLDLASLIDGPEPPANAPIALFPPSTSREAELFNRLFPQGLPAGVNLMRELVVAVRSGRVDLTPRDGSGWYDHQVHALETLLLPERGVEASKLLLTRAYKKRLIEAFEALVTKRRETHVRGLGVAVAAMAPPADPLTPRLRVEPNPTYYLRTARSYNFLADFLAAAVGEATLQGMHGLRDGGERADDLHTELNRMRDLFYGLYLLSAEDIGMAVGCLDAEPVDPARAEQVASDWLAHLADDPDLAVDTRVAVPIHWDPSRRTVRSWATIGVRLAPLDASYARGPKIRPTGAGHLGEWKDVLTESADYVIAVDEFAEFERAGDGVLDRAGLRAICDRHSTRASIASALAQ